MRDINSERKREKRGFYKKRFPWENSKNNVLNLPSTTMPMFCSKFGQE